MSGEVIEVNAQLENDPELVNEDPHGEGWIIKLKISDPSEADDLMSAEEYEKFVAEEDH